MTKKKTEGEKNTDRKYFKARDLNIIMILISCVLFTVLFFLCYFSFKEVLAYQESIRKYTEFKNNTIMMKNTSNYLTDQSRLFVITGDEKYAKKYFHELTVNKELNMAMQNIYRLFKYSGVEINKISAAFAQAENLTDIELYAMRLRYDSLENFKGYVPDEIKEIKLKESDRDISREEKKERAVNMLFDSAYLVYKMRIDENCDYRISEIESVNENELSEKFIKLKKKIMFFGVAQIFSFIFFFTVFVLNIAYLIKPINSYMKSISANGRLKEHGSQELRRLAKIYNENFDNKAATESILKQNADTDSLTGLLNRRAFDRICSDFEGNYSIAFVIIDVDDFKSVNDNYGHSSGDKVLKIISSELNETFRNSDYTARLGGDEFAVLLTNFNGNENSTIQNKINQINERLSIIREYGNISISVGAAISDRGFSHSLMEKADEALYVTKKNGKCGVTVVNHDDDSIIS